MPAAFNPNDAATWPVYLTFDEAAAIARVPKGTLRWWAAQGRIARQKAGRHPTVKRDDLIALIESSAAPTVR